MYVVFLILPLCCIVLIAVSKDYSQSKGSTIGFLLIYV